VGGGQRRQRLMFACHMPIHSDCQWPVTAAVRPHTRHTRHPFVGMMSFADRNSIRNREKPQAAANTDYLRRLPRLLLSVSFIWAWKLRAVALWEIRSDGDQKQQATSLIRS
jgi:hypothetical protein